MDNNFQDFKAYQMKLIVKVLSYFVWCMYLSLERHKFEKKMTTVKKFFNVFNIVIESLLGIYIID